MLEQWCVCVGVRLWSEYGFALSVCHCVAGLCCGMERRRQRSAHWVVIEEAFCAIGFVPFFVGRSVFFFFFILLLMFVFALFFLLVAGLV